MMRLRHRIIGCVLPGCCMAPGALTEPMQELGPAHGDLHLTDSATKAIDSAVLLPEITRDIDDQRRDKPDIGADELDSHKER